ncbi:MAG TPA: rhodanese-like domain-containing protein [Sphaerochaeta sp.]|nr:rhodanese-like domain-containing protein [Sphaerochaeta sp.]
MDKIIIIVVLVVVLLYAGNTLLQRRGLIGGAGYERISATEAKALMDEQTVIIVDVRSDLEYRGGHIQGAINLPVEEIGSSMPDLLPDQEALILLYCRSGSRSGQAARKLVELGYTNIYDFGGISAWGDELVR